MVNCADCGSPNVKFECPKCGTGYCAVHLAESDIYSCRKHPDFRYTKEEAIVLDNKCPIVMDSHCPLCSNLLKISTLPAGTKYLECTKCKWNSYSQAPIINYSTDKLVLREAEKYRIISRKEICSEKFKVIKGTRYCKNCLINYLSSRIKTPLNDITMNFGIPLSILPSVLSKMINDGKIQGIIKDDAFLFIKGSLKDDIINQLRTEGFVSLKDLSIKKQLSIDALTIIIFELIKEMGIMGCFDQNKEIYYLESYIIQYLESAIETKGRISIDALASNLSLGSQYIKNILIKMLKEEQIKGFFADKGTQILSVAKLESEVEAYCKVKEKFLLNDAADQLKVAVELVRRSLHSLIQKGKIRGIFTQKREFITEEYLSNTIKTLTKAYRIISLSDLSTRIGITELQVEETLASLIGRGAIAGYIDMARKEFVAEKTTQVVQAPIAQPAADATPNASAGQKPEVKDGSDSIQVVREYDFVGGQLRFKVVVRNMSEMAIHSVNVLLDVPTSFRRERDIIKIPLIEPKNSRGVDFYLEPAECGISTIGGIVAYKDAMGKQHTLHVAPKEVQIKCPLVIKTLDTIEDCQVAIQSLPSDARAFMIADLEPRLAYRAAYRAISSFETRNVTSYETDKEDNYEAEAWFSSEAKVTGGRIITRLYVSGKNQNIEIRVWCADPGQLTGFLAKIIEILFNEINVVRNIRKEERQKTIDVMAITQNLLAAQDVANVRYKASSALIKLSDTKKRLQIMLPKSDIILKIDYWLEKLGQYKENEDINDEDAEKLITDIDQFQVELSRVLTPR